jgi:hypothetical protein
MIFIYSLAVLSHHGKKRTVLNLRAYDYASNLSG